MSERVDSALSDARSEPSPLTALCELMGHPIQASVTTSSATVVPSYCACGIRWLAVSR
jgi:hypothetical protein